LGHINGNETGLEAKSQPSRAERASGPYARTWKIVHQMLW